MVQAFSNVTKKINCWTALVVLYADTSTNLFLFWLMLIPPAVNVLYLVMTVIVAGIMYLPCVSIPELIRLLYNAIFIERFPEFLLLDNSRHTVS